jgi:VanZ family protein
MTNDLKMTNAGWKWFFVVVWMLVIYLFSAQPYSGAVTGAYLGIFNILVRKIAHVLEYLILFLLCQSAFNASGPVASRHRTVFAVLLCVFYALTDEWHQSFIPGRSASINDVLVDTAGPLLAIAFLKLRGRLTSPAK